MQWGLIKIINVSYFPVKQTNHIPAGKTNYLLLLMMMMINTNNAVLILF